jgi:hypothetical protein
MEGLVRRKVWERFLQPSLSQTYDKVTGFATRFHYKIKRKRDKFDKLNVRLVIQGQHSASRMTPVRVITRTLLAPWHTDTFMPVAFVYFWPIATENDMFTDHVDISQAFTQGDLQPGDGYMGNLYISAPPSFPEDPAYCYRLLKPLYGMPSAARAWFQTMSTFLKQEGCSKVGSEESMWKTTVNGHDILLAAHIDDFILRAAIGPLSMLSGPGSSIILTAPTRAKFGPT